MLKDKKVMLPILLSDILVIISYFIYVFLPESAFANDVSRPGMTAVYIFAAAPVLCLVSAIIPAVFFKKIKQAFDEAEKSLLGIALCSASLLLYLICFVLELLYLISQISLGFLAPMNGTVYETYSVIIIAGSLIHLLICSVLLIKNKK